MCHLQQAARGNSHEADLACETSGEPCFTLGTKRLNKRIVNVAGGDFCQSQVCEALGSGEEFCARCGINAAHQSINIW